MEPRAAHLLRVGTMALGIVILCAALVVLRGLVVSAGVAAVATACDMTVIRTLLEDDEDDE